MAEIDNDFQIELFGGLDISKSKSKINADSIENRPEEANQRA